jgi:thymidylate kinase
VIFDQAFVQAVCSLVLLGESSDEANIVAALEMVPKPDLLVRLDAPRNILIDRLLERQRRQSVIEQMLEFDLETNLRSIEVVEHLHAHLWQREGYMTCSSTNDRSSLFEAARAIEREIVDAREARVYIAWENQSHFSRLTQQAGSASS